MTTKKYLTKSRFKLAVECPTKLFYGGKGREYRDQMAENDFMAMLAEGRSCSRRADPATRLQWGTCMGFSLHARSEQVDA